MDHRGPLELAATIGIWPALPLTGYVFLARRLTPGATALPAINRAGLSIVGGVALWSIPLLGSLVLRLYAPAMLGVAGWVATAILLGVVLRNGGLARFRARVSLSDAALLLALAPVAYVYLAFPTDTSMYGRDMMVYAHHAMYMAEHGRLDVPYPWSDADARFFSTAFQGYAGLYETQPTMTVQFGHLYPAWLAEVYASFGSAGLYRANGPIALLSAITLYGLLVIIRLRKTVAIAGAVILALNASQVWVSHITLTEVSAQLLIWTGLLLLVVALQTNDKVAARWGGGLLGLSTLVRIDSFVIVPLLLLAAALSMVLARASPASRAMWANVALTAAPAFATAAAYYALLSAPYVGEITRELMAIAAFGVIAAACLGASLVPSIRGFAASVFAHRGTVFAITVLVLGLAAFAYFYRPTMAPFAVINAPGHPLDGIRSHAEDSLVNLAIYLTPPVVALGLAGWCMTAWILRTGTRHELLPLWVITAVFSALYLWRPSIFPDHFWAIRRFVPVVIPGFIAFASMGSWWLSGRLRPPLRAAALAVTVALVVAYMGVSGWSVVTIREYRFAHQHLASIAASLPSDRPVLGFMSNDGSRHWMGALYMAFDRHVVPVAVETKHGQAAALAWIRSRIARGEPAYVVADSELSVTGLDVSRLENIRFQFLFVVPTVEPPVTRAEVHVLRLAAYRIDGYDPDG